jgi:hypothetical protein
MTDPRHSAYEALWESIKQKQAESMGVDIKGKAHFTKRSTGEDTFQWVAGPEIEDFYKRHGLTVLSSNSSDEPDITTFFFPKDRADLAALFKLTFA